MTLTVSFNLAYYDEENNVVTDRVLIAKDYIRGMFWIDFIGVFPFYLFALRIAGETGEDTDLSRYLSLLRLLRLVRLHRVKELFDILQYNTHVSLTALTLTRNFGAALVWTHFAACGMYFIARQKGYDDQQTWIGGLVYGQTPVERYITSLYWSVVTFTTVG
jgi:potassium channel